MFNKMNYELIMNYERIAKSPNEIEEISTFVLFFIIYWVVSFVLAAGYRTYLPAPYLDIHGHRFTPSLQERRGS